MMERKYGEYQKILLNLKWFVKQLCRVFEEKLERRCTKHQWSLTNSVVDESLSNGHSRPPSVSLSTNSTPKHMSWTYSLSNSPIMKRLSALQKYSGSPIKKSSSLRSSHVAISRLMVLKASTSQAEREKNLKRFGEHISIVYEYQIGMLSSLQSVSVVVVYVVDLLLKAIKKGVLLNLDSANLNPTILFDSTVIPKSGSKLVKTVGIGVHSNSLTWKVNNIFTHPGLRHNQVGGEDCSNLSIVTHLLTGFCPFGESRRPDIYGYRNLIVVPRRRTTKNDKELKTGLTAFEISLYDSATISHARTHSADTTPSTSTNTLLDHIHKCYKSIFFVIFDRPTVIEHLMTCQSFRIFCRKELITPVMFLTSFSDTTKNSNHKSLFHNFDLFNICVTAQPKLTQNRPRSLALSDCEGKSPKFNNSDFDKQSHSNLESPDLNQNEEHWASDTTSDTTSSFISREYDNFGFHI